MSKPTDDLQLEKYKLALRKYKRLARGLRSLHTKGKEDLDRLLEGRLGLGTAVLLRSGAATCREVVGDEVFYEVVDRVGAIVRRRMGFFTLS
jgi:hypothetical protein